MELDLRKIESRKTNYPLRIDKANGIVYAWFTRMEYRGATVTSDLEPKLILFEDKYYDIYQKVGNEIFVDLFSKMHSNIRQFFARNTTVPFLLW